MTTGLEQVEQAREVGAREARKGAERGGEVGSDEQEEGWPERRKEMVEEEEEMGEGWTAVVKTLNE